MRAVASTARMAAAACSYASQPLVNHAALGGTFSELLREQHMLPSAPDHEVSERYWRPLMQRASETCNIT